MKANVLKTGIQSGRVPADVLATNFADLHPPLSNHEARAAADRCYFCFDAPCITACPTDIDIPLFIRQIQTGTPEAAAKTIFSQNILGGMCARVCPTETLCEQACVREKAEGKPVLIGQLQRFATDSLMDSGVHPFERAKPSGKRVAIVGAGPAGLSCAHRLAMHGHEIVVFDARAKAGGLNEYGIARYKAIGDFAADEIAWLLKIGGISIEFGKTLGRDFTLAQLNAEYDAVFLGVGLAGTNSLNIENDAMDGVADAVDFIADLRQASDLTNVPIGRDVVVIGGGMTAIDAAVQAKALGALNVTLVYRRSLERMNASLFERNLATSKGVRILTNATPVAIRGDGAVREVVFQYTDDKLNPVGAEFTLAADQIFKAVGQNLVHEELPKIERNKVLVDANGRTSLVGVWAGGDCASGGNDLTVTAVAEGRNAAEDILKSLTANA